MEQGKIKIPVWFICSIGMSNTKFKIESGVLSRVEKVGSTFRLTVDAGSAHYSLPPKNIFYSKQAAKKRLDIEQKRRGTKFLIIDEKRNDYEQS